MNRILSWFCYIFLKPIVKLIWIKEIKGWGNIPKGNFILTSNHQSHWDQVINGYLCAPRRFTYLGQIDKYAGFDGFLRNLLYKIADVVPIHRYQEESKKRAMKECIKRLKRGDILIMYPEGTRSKDGKIGEGKPGIAFLHLISGVPILPVAIKGNFEIMPLGSSFPKLKKIVKINIGTPLSFLEEKEKIKNLSLGDLQTKEVCLKITQKIMAEIKKLFEEI